MAILLLLGLNSAIRAQDQADGRGVLDILVVDTYGRPLKSFEVEITSRGGTPAISRRLSQSGSLELPYGAYSLRGRASLHEPVTRNVFLRQSYAFVVFAFPFRDPGDSDVVRTSLRGRIINSRSGAAPDWVRAISVFGDFVGNARIDSTGRFEVPEVPYGEYLLLSMKSSQVLRVVRFKKTLEENDALIDFSAAPSIKD